MTVDVIGAENVKIREWYMNEYPTDSLGKEINTDITFYNLFECLDYYHNVYDFIGVHDSIVRERCFAKLAEIMACDYDDIYNQWLRNVY